MLDDRCVHELFESCARENPDALALIAGDRYLSYGELNRRANQLARCLRAQGVGLESPVVICAERSLEMIVGILAALKAGGCYVPLDPRTPPARLERIVAESNCDVVLCDNDLLEALPFLSSKKTLPLDEEIQSLLLKQFSAHDLSSAEFGFSSRQLAYVIYTSGSTGAAKATAIQHQSIVRLVHNSFFDFAGASCILCAASPSFDAFTFELWGALAHGGCSVLLDLSSVTFAEIEHVLVRHSVDCAWLTSSLFNQVISSSPGTLSSLKHLLIGGEALSVAHVRMAQQALPNTQLINGYGPTECTTFACTYRIPRADLADWPSIPIGTAIDHTDIYVVDADGRLVEGDTVGELLLGGPGVARGYLGNAALTAEKFVPNPFGGTPGDRLYKTGDLVRYRADGKLDFLGRADEQVKLRGFRIELGEIEAALCRNPEVRQAAVVARRDENDATTRLVAYVVARGEAAESNDAIHRALLSSLQEELPDYMVPAAFMFLDSLPLTLNGKVDRRALPAPDESAYLHAQYVAPRTELESTLVEIYQANLSVDRVGVLDDYFALGGDSMRAIALVSDARQRGLQISIAELFTNPAIADLSKVIVSHESGARGLTPVPRFALLSEEDQRFIAAHYEMAAVDDAFPLSMLQQGMIFHSLLDQRLHVYHDIVTYRIRVEWKAAELRQALAHVTARHELLRTVFRVDDGRSLQIVLKHKELPLEIFNLTALEPGAQVQAIRQWIDIEKRNDIELPVSPLRVSVHVLGANEILLGLSFHHVLWDGWSDASFVKELFAAYGEICARGELADAPPALSFKHFVALERSALASEDSRQYWARKLEDAELPWWSGTKNEANARFECEIAPAVSEAIVALSRNLGVQEKSVWCAAYLSLISLLDGSSDVIGSTVSHARPEVTGGDEMLGLFLNCLPIRMSVSGMRWVDLIKAVEQELREQYSVRHYPLAMIQRDTGLDFSASLFNYMNFHVHADANDSIGIRTDVGFVETNYLFTFNVRKSEASGRHVVHIDCPPSAFAEEFRERIKTYVANIVDTIGLRPWTPIEKTLLLDQQERQRLLVDCNDTARSYPRDRMVHELFEAQVQRTQDAIALVYEECNLSYRELNRHANQLAHYLLATGVGPEKRVGICLPRCIDAVVGIVGTLKAGGCYVPLDPEQPPERIRNLVCDAQLTTLITEAGHVDKLGDVSCPVLCLEELFEQEEYLHVLPTGNIPSSLIRLNPGNSAYLIYTSGSTGTPKAVVVQHGSLTNFCCEVVRVRGFDTGSRNLQFAPLVFDAATAEIWNALISGSLLHLPLGQTLASHESFARYVRERRINRGYIPPAFLSVLDKRDFESYLTISVGGEAVPRHIVDEWSSVCRLVNAYGPAECTIACTQGICSGEERVTIGTPLANVSAYVLNPDCELVPTGVRGELCIGGVCLSRGYANDSALTARKFIPNPFSDEPGARLYRTGDLVRRLPNSNLEFIGRIDQQVKIRGFRIELGEIDANLAKHSRVTDVAVVARERAGAGKQLVAYLVLDEAGSTRDAIVKDLRAHAQERLPSYMVPSAFVVLDAMPRTPSGKVDRKALPKPDRNSEGRAYFAPEGVAEELLASLWCSVLHAERVGREDNFFELGGHSLLATQLVSRIREAFGVELPIRTVFEQQTLRAQAQAIEEAKAGELGEVAPLESRPRSEAEPLSFAQERLWFLSQFMGPSAVYTIPLALRLSGEVDENALLRGLHTLVERHESLRTRFEVRDGAAVQVVEPASSITVEVERVGSEEQVEAICREERAYCFDLSRERLCRIRLLRKESESAREHVLLLTMHHSVSDAWSMGVFFRELVALYAAYAKGERSPLEALPIQYADYAQWQRQCLQGEMLERQVNYWRDQLVDLPPLLELPTDKPRPAQQTYRGATLPFAASKELQDRLQELSRRSGVTMFMTLLSGFAVLLSRYAGQTDLAIGTPIANRTRSEIEGLIGFFVNTLVLRSDLSDEPCFVDLLKRTRETALQAYAHQDVPFEHLVEVLNPQRSLSHSPLFQVMLALQNAPMDAVSLPAVKVSPVSLGEDAGVARFDLTLSLSETSNGLTGALEYNTDLFERSTMVSLLEHYERLLQAIVARPEEPVTRYEFLSAADDQRLLQHLQRRKEQERADRELEQLLCRHPQVQEAVVVRKEGSLEKALTAYVVASEQDEELVSRLRKYIRTQPTMYLMPSQISVLDCLPLTPEGRVNRRALLAMERRDAAQSYLPPEGMTEELLSSLWCAVLQVDRIGREDNFFERGGHSLLATQLVSRIREAFGVELPIRSLFEQQTLRGQAQVIEAAKTGEQHAVVPLVKRSSEERTRLSFAQERLWFLSQFMGPSPVYNIPLALRLRGEVNEAALLRSLQGIVARHESLRTRFEVSDGRAIQVIEPASSLSVHVESVGSEAQVETICREERLHCFDLSRERLCRIRVLKSASEYVLLVTMHHSVADGWSLGVFFQELATLYTAFAKGEGSPLEALPIQYADYAQWQRQWLQGEVLERQLSYWRDQLAGLPPLLELPTDRPRPVEQTYRGATLPFAVSKQLQEQLQQLSRQTGVTMFMTLLSGFAVLLSRYANQTDVAIGTMIANRTRSETERLIGFFVNTLVLRSDLSDAPRFVDLLKRTRETALQAYAHQDIPFEHLVEALNPQRSLSHSPLFQVMLALQNAPMDAVSLPGVEVSTLGESADVARFDLTLGLSETSGGLTGVLEYNTDLFNRSTMQRLLEHYERLLRAIAARPEECVTRYEFLSEAEKRQQLIEWNATQMSYPQDQCIHQLFESQAEKTPDAIALVYEDQQLSYAHLNARANQIAHALVSQGVGPEVRVGICVERSASMLIGLLGILKAGGCYVPLDPAYPKARLEYLLADSGVSLVLTERALRERLQLEELVEQELRTLCLDDEASWAACAAESLHTNERLSAAKNLRTDARSSAAKTLRAEEPLSIAKDLSAAKVVSAAKNPHSPVSSQNLAYMIYTSGSTGRPKGVRISHQNAVNFLTSIQEEPGVSAPDRLLAVTTLSFDIALLELFAPLMVGATVVIAGSEVVTDVERIAEQIATGGITLLQATPVTWRTLLHSGWGGAPGLKALIGGEAVTRELSLELAPRVQALWNMYGPTETTVWSTVQHLLSSDSAIRIGRPIGNTQVYVLDKEHQLVPVGVLGELCIGGSGVAQGYLNKGAITAERFIPDPFSATPGKLLYRTGDLVRHGSDGALEYVGRIDHQVKVRGFRIELGEIESVLTRHAWVKDVVVMAREDVAHHKQLVAYVVPQQTAPREPEEMAAGLLHADEVAQAAVPSAEAPQRGAALNAGAVPGGVVISGALPRASVEAALRAHVQAQLPSYMVPASIVLLDALPLTPNGKVDRKALPAPDHSDETHAYRAPQGMTEELLASLWSAVLQVNQVGREDNFFERGGHSLLATQLVSRIREVFSVELPIRSLFEQQTLRGLAQAIETAKTGEQPFVVPLVRYSRDKGTPLSFAQERLWFLGQYMGPSAVYNIPLALRLSGQVNETALLGSLQTIVDRHESLRTRFAVIDGVTMQVIDPASSLPVQMESVDSNAELESICRAERMYCFDLSQERLCRIRVLKSASEYVLLVTMHHSVSDGWSVAVFFRELVALYEAYAKGEPSPLAPLAIQYADYAQWQRQWLQGEVLGQQVSYWRDQLADLPPLLELPTDRPRPTQQTYRGAALPFRVSKQLQDELHELSGQAGVTMFMTLLSAFAVLLSRYANQTDVAIGTPIANRTRTETESLIGFFVNTLVLRNDLSDEPRFVDLLKRTRETALQAYAHQDVPFEHLVEALNPARSLSHSPLFQVSFSLLNNPQSAVSLSSVTVSPVQVLSEGEAGVARYDLTFNMQETAQGIFGELEYNTDLFDRSRMQRLLEHYERLLRAIVARPEERVSRYEFLSEAEKHQQLIEWNATQRAYPQDLCVHELFEAQARERPDAVALVHEDRQLTYGELNSSANQLARYLRAQQVSAESRVGVCLERSPEMVIGILGILKAGAAYVPLDPSYPEARLLQMIEQSGCELILSESALLTELPFLSEHKSLPLDGELHEVLLGSYSTEDLGANGVSPENLAYVIYTSGSTGQPKGSGIIHRNITRLIYADYVQLSAQRSMLCAASPSFDAFTFELWGALLHGGRCVLADFKQLSFEQLGRLLKQEGVDCAWLTAGLFNQVVNESAELLSSVNELLVGGEALSVDHIGTALQSLPHTQLINGYGPTESTTFACTHRINAVSAGCSVPIGRPISNTQVYVLDGHGQLAAPGVLGELHIGGAGLSRGYINSARLTAEKFVPHPFSPNGERLYRTGDLVRYAADGALEYVGRIDHQVKVRGFRIELGEIETVLTQHPQVRDAVVMAREDVPDHKQLVAYVVANVSSDHERQEIAASLRVHVQEVLPSYMVPAAIVVLDSLPLTSNGKVDRNALPAPDRNELLVYVAPEGMTEELLANLWCSVLHVDRVGREDSFFERGGHSLLATQLVSRIREAFGIELPIRTLFEQQTLRGLAQAIDAATTRDQQSVVPLVKRTSDEAPPLSFAQERLWFLSQYMGPSTVYNIPLALRLKGKIDEAALLGSLQAIVDRHESLRTRFELRAGVPVQVIEPGTVSVQVESVRNEAQVETICHEERSYCFDLSRDRLWRIRLLRQESTAPEYVLLVTMHHSVSDAWSLGVFFRELLALYEAYAKGEPSPLPALPIQYADFAQWQRQWLQGDVLERQVNYWRDQLADLPPLLELPTDRPRPAQQTYRGATLPFRVSKQLQDELQDLSGRAGVTMFMTLLSGFAVLLSRYAGQTDIAIGTPIANRTRSEIEGLIGFFVNTLVLRSDLSDEPRFVDLLKRTRETALQAYAHQDVPFEHLVEALNPHRSLSHSPLFQVMLALQNAPMDTVSSGDIAISTMNFAADMQDNTARFDLTLSLSETPNGLVGGLEYNTDLFDHSTMQRLLEHYESLLQAIATQPEERVTRYEFLSEAEKQKLAEYIRQRHDQEKEARELEQLLCCHAHVKDAVVVRNERSEERQLTAFIVAREQGAIAEEDLVSGLRRYIRTQPSMYLMPSQIVVLDALPLTPKGKVDRKALRASDRSDEAHAYRAPQGMTEELLSNLWCAVLQVDQVGREDNFFERGGHSLLATQLVSRIREAFCVELPIRTLFEQQTLRGQAQVIEAAKTREQRALVPLVKRSSEDRPRLSFAQERLWFLSQYMGLSAVYNMPFALRLSGQVSEAGLLASLHTIIDRHEALRTRFVVSDGVAVQVIEPAASILVERVWSQAQIESICRAERSYCFDLSRERLCRIRVLKSTSEYVLLVTMHHSVSDGWSMAVFFRELVALYEAYIKGVASPLAPLPIQYADYAQWQRQWLQGEVLEQQLSYWRAQLAGLPPLLELPTDRPRPVEQTHRGATVPFATSKGLQDRLQELSRQSGVTMFMTLLSGFAVLLGRYANQTDVAIGTPIANRTRTETESLIGFFVNTLVLRSDLSDAPRFVDLLKRTRETALQAYAHQDVPFEHLVEALNPARSLSHSPLFQVMLMLQNAPMDAVALPGVEVSTLGESAGVARFDLTLSLSETATGLVGGIEYNTDLFNRSTMQRLLEHYERLLQAIVARPEERVTRYEFLSEAEKHQQLIEWNATQMSYPQDQCIHQLFESQAEKTPDAIALVYEDQQLSYAHLNARANQIAHALASQGVGPEVRVGICVERSASMLIGLLGILKAGGCYVPLDPAYPKARLEYLLADSGVSLVLTERALRERLQLEELVEQELRTLCLDDEASWAACAAESLRTNERLSAAKNLRTDARSRAAKTLRAEEPLSIAEDLSAARAVGTSKNPRSPVSSQNLAYMIYTSGSTGRPKGVRISHQNAVNFLTSIQEEPGVSALDRLLAVTTLSFDIALLELFAPLMVGATVVIAGSEVVTDVERIAEQIATRGITLLQATPVTWRTLLHSGWGGAPGLKALIGGEAVTRELSLELAPRAQALWNMYGPTETTVWSTVQHLLSSDSAIRIGHPIGNTQVYVLDKEHQLVPVGVLGELCIGGSGVAQGYLNKGAITAERFIPDPFSATPGKLLYRTGDLVRHGSDGALEYVGRIDHQVKVRGFRIELGEIESVLTRHAWVKDVVVMAREDVADHKQLVAYVVPQQTAPREPEEMAAGLHADVVAQAAVPSAEAPQRGAVLNAGAVPGGAVIAGALPKASVEAALRAHVQAQLPSYMVPASIVLLETLPLTPNGKVDRKALPAPDQSSESRVYTPPEGETEELLAHLWSAVLRVDRVGREDNFFELGGHSLLATQLLSRIRETFSIELRMQSLYAQASLRESAAHIDKLVEIDRLDEARLDSMTDDEAEELLKELST
jgi:amino acid adenylation domain-containing protein